MVHEKKKSGDPDYDDKVPADEHAGTVVTAGDGKVIGRLDPSLGPVTPEGSHLNIDTTPNDLDTRPAPGQVAEVKADVQVVDADSAPAKEVSVDQLRNAEPAAAVSQSGDLVEQPAADGPARPGPKRPAGK